MHPEVFGISILWLFLYGYLIVASIDFGAGFYSYYCKLKKKDHITNGLIHRYLSPVWEVTNVFLIFFMVGLIGFFPDTAYYYGTALLIPGSLALVLLVIRGSFYAFSRYGARESSLYMFLYGSTGLLIPASLSTVLTISQGGFIEEQNGLIVFKAKELLLNPYSWSVVLLAIVSVLFISASFLTYYARKAQDQPAERVLRGFALSWSVPTILASIFVFLSLRQHSPWHFESIVELAWMFGASLFFFSIAVGLLWSKAAYGCAFLCVMCQFGFAFYGYGASHLPYILYPYITIQDSVTNPQMLDALILAFLAGLMLLLPSLYLLVRLFLFNARYVKGSGS
ncbi:cytochrome d ubiquinol oxidase subunit II [Ammoniphilus sp. CFH 90114]|uniref:cytochrome d ubiquinol oxidase subunit II n=1 Tax=Ammoniphilus sp. CFH 90114 TaxID=2493665 RepID=UPI00100E9A59|nr:cytochrome d ubiquinol oxidase subunit II [Ammoniphilus sp. CFH 90114]RXT08172.1 cytochrome d ubiquinol oxidase subunit II [Ammoniphilus sp. CFH 90114]